jgi:4'-phosphopantetheinyl transferase
MSTPEEMWASPPAPPLLPRGSVHVWRAFLDLSAEALARTEGLLSASERERCARLIRPRDRALCTAARVSLRTVLAHHGAGDPRALAFSTGPFGKPALDDSPLHFNASHSEDLALVAVSHVGRVGIDVERIRSVGEMDAIIDDFFSGPEKAYVRSRAEADRTPAFFLLWTRREAAAKALGLDLFDSFDRLVLPAVDRDRRGFRVSLPKPGLSGGTTADWWMRDLVPAAGFAGALCLEGSNAEPAFWELAV